MSELSENVPIGAGWRSSSCPLGDIDNESEGAEPDDDHGGRERQRTDPGAGGGTDGLGVAAGQAPLAAVAGGRRGRLDPSAAWPGGLAAQGPRRASASAGALRRGSLCGLRPDAAGRGTGEGGNQGGSRHGGMGGAGGGGSAAAPPKTTAPTKGGGGAAGGEPPGRRRKAPPRRWGGPQAFFGGDGARGRPPPRLV